MIRWSSLFPEDLRRAFNQCPYKLLVLLVAADLVFIVLHILAINTDLINRRLFLMGKDDGYAEVYQYIKEFWVVILLAYLFVRRPSYLFASWCLVFSYIFVDDALGVHQHVGGVITGYFGFNGAFGLPGYQFGEFVFAAIVGALLLIVIGASSLLSSKKQRSVSNSLLFLLLGFFFFSFFFDFIHEFFMDAEFRWIFTAIEDGGEMVVMSVIAWYLFYLEPENAVT